MLIEVTVGNFRSIRDRNTLSMVATQLAAKDPRVDDLNAFDASPDLRLLKLAAMYGANASGKSNFIAGLRFMREFVLTSSRESSVRDPIATEPFRLNPRYAALASYFEVVFIHKGTPYRYGFEVTPEKVVAEWLFSAPNGREARLFARDGSSFEVNRRSFREGRDLDEKTRPNALFLSVVAQFNGKLASELLEWFGNLRIISGLSDVEYRDFTFRRCENEQNRSVVLKFARALDLGIDDFKVSRRPLHESLPKGLPAVFVDFVRKETSGAEDHSVQTLHRLFNDEGEQVGQEYFDLESHESEGTQKLLALAGPILDALSNAPERVLVIDEIDARLHAKLTRAILRVFRKPSTNPRNAQLIFTTHDVGLLRPSSIRRDQVWFATKNEFGATTLRSLAEFKGVRNDSSYRNSYLQGRFGAVPRIRNVDDVVEASEYEETAL